MLYRIPFREFTTLISASRGRGRWISEFEASLIYRVSSRTARATQRNPVSDEQPSRRNRVGI